MNQLPVIVILVLLALNNSAVPSYTPKFAVDEYFSIDYEAAAMYEYGNIKSEVKVFECEACEDTGKIKSGDGLFEQDCPFCTEVTYTPELPPSVDVEEIIPPKIEIAKNTTFNRYDGQPYRVYYFSAEWCGPCKQVKEEFKNVDGYKGYRVLHSAQDVVDRPHFVILDLDKDAKLIEQLFPNLSIPSIPRFIGVNEKTGKITFNVDGSRTWNQIVNLYYNGYHNEF